MGGKVPVRLTGVGKRFGRTVALDDVTLDIEEGEVFGYLGPNGAGKTTTIRMVMGMLRPSAGKVEVLGLDSWRDAVEIHRQVGYVPGEPALYAKMTGAEHIEFFANLRGGNGRKAAEVTAERLELDLGRPVRALSRGNRQKMAVVLAFMSTPRLLVLDEPTSGLDPLVQQEFQAMVRERTAAGGTVLLSSHVLGEVQRVADRIGVVREGRLIAVERLHELAAKSLHRVRASFTAPVSAAEFSDIAGVRDLRVSDHTMTCSAPQPALDALLKRVSAHPVEDFECAEAELEDTFLAYYGSQATSGGSQATSGGGHAG